MQFLLLVRDLFCFTVLMHMTKRTRTDNTDGANVRGQRENSYEFVLRIDAAFGLAFSVFLLLLLRRKLLVSVDVV